VSDVPVNATRVPDFETSPAPNTATAVRRKKQAIGNEILDFIAAFLPEKNLESIKLSGMDGMKKMYKQRWVAKLAIPWATEFLPRDTSHAFLSSPKTATPFEPYYERGHISCQELLFCLIPRNWRNYLAG
jgi:hypothetical protein